MLDEIFHVLKFCFSHAKSLTGGKSAVLSSRHIPILVLHMMAVEISEMIVRNYEISSI